MSGNCWHHGILPSESTDLKHDPAFLVLICHRRAVLLKMAVPAVRLRVVGLQVQGARVRISAG